MKELATSDGKGDEEIEEPEDDEDEDEEGSKKKSKGGGMAANAAIVKKLGAMWAAASADEKATFEAQVAKQKEVGADKRQVWNTGIWFVSNASSRVFPCRFVCNEHDA